MWCMMPVDVEEDRNSSTVQFGVGVWVCGCG